MLNPPPLVCGSEKLREQTGKVSLRLGWQDIAKLRPDFAFASATCRRSPEQIGQRSSSINLRTRMEWQKLSGKQQISNGEQWVSTKMVTL